MVNPQTDASAGGEETAGKVESADSWEVSPGGATKGGGPPALVESPPSAAAETQGGVGLKVATTTVLQPICLGDGPLMLPIHLQMAGAAGAQLGQIGASQCFLTNQGPVSLPLVLDQQLLQHLGSAVLPQGAGCPVLPLQSNMLCQNATAALAFGPPPAGGQKSAGHFQDAGVLSLLQNPAFAALLQDLFSSQTTGASSFQPPADSFANSSFFPPPPPPPPPTGSHPYSSPLAPLVPPATLLVPYPVVIPLPVPLPIPLPIPVPVPAEDSKGNVRRTVSTVSRSTQTPKDPAAATTNAPLLSDAGVPSPASSSSTPPPAEGEALDLSVRTGPLKPKQEFPCLQDDDVLDLSVPSAWKRCTQPAVVGRSPPREGDRVFTLRSTQDSSATATALSLGVLRPVECPPGVDSKLLSGLASLEFSRKHKWLVDSSSGGGGASGSGSLGRETSLCGTRKLEIVSTSQTAKVIVSVKDAIPAILCGKIKGLSGVSTKNFSIRPDGTAGPTLQQLCGAASRAHAEQQDSGNPHRKLPKTRAIKLKKVSSQEIHIVPIKKQRLAAFIPRKGP